MDTTLRSNFVFRECDIEREVICSIMNLAQAKINTEYTIKDIKTEDEELKHFLFTLGCYKGEKVTVISILAENFIISVKDARYSIDIDLAESIII
jgi:ferrous iron transport protein A